MFAALTVAPEKRLNSTLASSLFDALSFSSFKNSNQVCSAVGHAVGFDFLRSPVLFSHLKINIHSFAFFSLTTKKIIMIISIEVALLAKVNNVLNFFRDFKNNSSQNNNTSMHQWSVNVKLQGCQKHGCRL